MTEKPLGRRPPGDFVHEERYRLRIPRAVQSVERFLPLPYTFRRGYNQGQEGACVGFAASWMMSILNGRFYDARWLYRMAQEIDEWGDTPPAEGTSVRAGMDVLRDVGHRRYIKGMLNHAPNLVHGIAENRWAKTVDEIRTCIAEGMPVVLGIDWMSNFDTPVNKRSGWWIGEGDLGRVRGGHAICCYAASDRRQAVRLVNSWGMAYPLVWMGYDTLQKLLDGISWPGEATVITDR